MATTALMSFSSSFEKFSTFFTASSTPAVPTVAITIEDAIIFSPSSNITALDVVEPISTPNVYIILSFISCLLVYKLPQKKYVNNITNIYVIRLSIIILFVNMHFKHIYILFFVYFLFIFLFKIFFCLFRIFISSL